MKSSIFAIVTAAALSIGASGAAFAQTAVVLAPLTPVMDDCPINTEGVETESGVATPMGESLVDEDGVGTGDDDGELEDGQIPVDECMDDDRFPGIGEGVIEGTVDADDSGADSISN
jgi:hypothetical protein